MDQSSYALSFWLISEKVKSSRGLLGKIFVLDGRKEYEEASH
jgi:hypothetical protein